MKGRVLIVAGSDSGGGAGIQADTKAVTALAGFAMTAISALTVQNTTGVHDVLPVPPEFLRAQIKAVIEDIGIDALKTGMLDRASVIEVVAEAFTPYHGKVPFVLDPVMVAKGGAVLLRADATSVLRETLLPLADVLTPNIPEAESLLGAPIETVEQMEQAGVALRAMGARNVLVKGGHMAGDVLTDVLVTKDGTELFTDQRIPTCHTHGTGCTLASAIATGLAQGMSLREAVVRARAYLRLAISNAPGYGKGAGPVDHTVTVAEQWRA